MTHFFKTHNHYMKYFTIVYDGQGISKLRWKTDY